MCNVPNVTAPVDMTAHITDNFWLRLDNAAKIFPAVKDSELTSVLRISVELHNRIKIREFLETVKCIENRFPYYNVRLSTGFFWYYLESDKLLVKTFVDKGVPCRQFGKKEILHRILVRENRISVEFSHILTDGTGAFEFLKTLVFCYFEKCGLKLPSQLDYFKPDQKASVEEFEDAYSRYFTKITSPVTGIPEAFHLPFSLKPKPRFSIILGIIPVDEIVKKAKEHEVSLTEYLTAVYLYALQEIYKSLPERSRRKSQKKIRIEVPVNLRKMFPSKTMRNFSLYVMPEIDLRLGDYSFEELTKTVYHQMKLETDKKLINKMISRNVGSERNILVKSIPLVVKSLILSRVYKQGVRKYSGVITNLGKINFPPEINTLIKRFVFIPPPANKNLKVNCGVVGFNNHLVISFGNITRSKALEKTFFSFLVQQGIPVKIENYSS